MTLLVSENLFTQKCLVHDDTCVECLGILREPAIQEPQAQLHRSNSHGQMATREKLQERNSGFPMTYGDKRETVLSTSLMVESCLFIGP